MSRLKNRLNIVRWLSPSYWVALIHRYIHVVTVLSVTVGFTAIMNHSVVFGEEVIRTEDSDMAASRVIYEEHNIEEDVVMSYSKKSKTIYVKIHDNSHYAGVVGTTHAALNDLSIVQDKALSCGEDLFQAADARTCVANAGTIVIISGDRGVRDDFVSIPFGGKKVNLFVHRK